MIPDATSLHVTPRAEYPRPQFARRDWCCLNGEWEFAFDDHDRGLQEEWFRRESLDLQIVVPFAYQTAMSGINDQSIHEVVWYARNLEVPLEWAGQASLLHFGAVDYRTTVWVNGAEVGHNQGGHVPFSLDIRPYLRESGNRVVLRVEDRQDGHQPRGKQASSGVPGGIDYYCTTGIWQTVWLEPVPHLRIESLNISSCVETGTVEIRVFLHAPATGWRVQAEALSNGEVVAEAVLETSQAGARLSLKIPDAKLWSPDAPHLYDLRVRLWSENQVLDEVASYAGLRRVESRDGCLYLNGAPIFLRMVLDQGYWPQGGMTAPSDDALRADVEWTKRFGFNGARKHQKIEDPRWLYWCDKLGVLVWGEMANARFWSPQAEEWLLAEWERAVRRDLNHPCIICWVPINESMGAPHLAQSHPGQYAFVERTVALTRRIDLERPVIDNDGWEHTDVGDICAVHDYTPTAEKLAERYAATLAEGSLPRTVWYADKPLFVRGARYRGQPIMLTEVGGFLQSVASDQKRDGLYNFYASFDSSEELLEQYRDLMSGLSRLPFLAGFCYTQLTDIEQEMNGLLTYDRQPKIEPEATAAIHREYFCSEFADSVAQWRRTWMRAREEPRD